MSVPRTLHQVGEDALERLVGGGDLEQPDAGVAGDARQQLGEPQERRPPRRCSTSSSSWTPAVEPSAISAAASARSSVERIDVLVRPVGHQPADLAEVAGRGVAAGHHHLDLLRELLDLLEDVRAEQDRAALRAHLPQQVHEVQALARVHAVERLVEQQHGRVVHQRRGHLDALPHALGVLADLAVLGVTPSRRRPARAARRRRGRAGRAARRWPVRTRHPVRKSYTASRSGTSPMRAVDLAGCCQTGSPSSVTVPADGARNPAIMWISVDLPAPLGPSRPVMPGPIVMVTSLTATTLPYQRETVSTDEDRGDHETATFR